MNNKNNEFDLLAKTFHGLEDVLYAELKELGAKSIIKGNRAVEFRGNKALMYRANFYLRTALRILKPIKKFIAKNENELYENIQTINWDSYFGINNTFAIDSTVNSNYFSHSKYVALKVKDAIVDQFRVKYNKRPYVDTDEPDLKINIHISNDQCTVSLDSSGDSLHKRGYRKKQGKAPLNEVLAAGMILLSGWNKKKTFIDPMCGSGTLLIEAAMIAHNIPPGIYRKKFAFENWVDFDEKLFEEIYEESSPSPTQSNIKITGSDISDIAIRIARENIANAALGKKITIQTRPIENFKPPKDEKGMIITNPPYGERIKKSEINNFYKVLGNKFKNEYTGYEIWILTNNFEAMKHIGLHPSLKIKLYNGALECKYLKYDIYEGSKKDKNRH